MKFLVLIFINLILIQLNEYLIYANEINSILKNQTVLYETKYFNTLLDHFNVTNDTLKFPMKYLISTKFWIKGNAILFYCGNEDKIELFSDNSGFIWELGEQLSAMVVFAEHRYYGTSLPFGNMSLDSPKYFKYLNTEQALTDFVSLLTYLKSTIDGASSSPVIAFGGSYGGMLAAWMRQKYPKIIAGALASSAPFLMVNNFENCNKIYQVITQSYNKSGNEECVGNIRNIWSTLQRENNTNGLDKLSNIFHTCKPLKQIETLRETLLDALFGMGTANYPYPTDFLNPLPRWPVSMFCKHLSVPIKDPMTLLKTFNVAIQIYFNYTKQLTCLPIDYSSSKSAWSVQECTELPFPKCTNGVTDMFFDQNFTKADFYKSCNDSYGVELQPRSSGLFRTHNELNGASNIIFSYGGLDPWTAGVLLETTNKLVNIIPIFDGAHHIDLRGSNSMDPLDLQLARKLEKSIIQKWITQWKT